jgi:hypothetical protein
MNAILPCEQRLRQAVLDGDASAAASVVAFVDAVKSSA